MSLTLPLAHLAGANLGPWWAGMAQLFLEPTTLLLVIGLVLLALQSASPRRERLLLVLPLAWLLGGLFGLSLPSDLLQGPASTALVSVLGVLVALQVQLGARVLLPLAAVLSSQFALAAGSALAGHKGAVQALLGETVAIAVLSMLLFSLLAPPHPHWRAIGLRVAGSWIAAASLLMLGWQLRHPP